MKIKINGKEESVPVRKILKDLITEKGLCAEKIVVEHNSRIIAKDEWPKVALQEHDTVEIVSFVGGG